MKKLSLLALPLALLAFGSCDSNETQSTDVAGELGIVPVSSYKSNRGYSEGNDFFETLTADLHEDDATKETNKKVREMHISAYLTPQNGEPREYFKDKIFRQAEDGNYWRNYLVEGTPDQAGYWDIAPDKFDPIYWPVGGKLDFLAFSISSEGPQPQSVQWASKTADQVVLGLANGCSQNDILYAGAYGVTATQDAGKVNMKFNHAQAWLEFVLTGETDAENVSIVLDEIQLENVFKTGTLTIRNNESKAFAEWSFSNGDKRQDVTVDNKYEVKGLSAENSYLDMLIPQQQQTAFLLKYHFSNDAATVLEYEFTLSDKGFWNMGEKYIYTIHLNANEVTVTPTVEKWGEQEYVQLDSEKLSMKAIGGASVGKVFVNGQEYDPMKLYHVNDVLTISAVANAGEFFRWEDSTTVKNGPITVTVKELMENPCHVLFYTDKVIPFAYSVSDDKKVYFASGNLYCDTTDGNVKFAFEKNQYDFRTRGTSGNAMGSCINGTYSATGNTPVNTSGLFQWVSPNAAGATPGILATFGAFSELDYDKRTGDADDSVDFGKAMGEGSGWSTLTEDEWSYIKGHSNNNLGQTMLSFAGVKGAVLSPDSYTDALPTNNGDAAKWNGYEASGLVFLPAAGFFYVGRVHDVGDRGIYWSSSATDTDNACILYFSGGDSDVDGSIRDFGYSVRLVWPAE